VRCASLLLNANAMRCCRHPAGWLTIFELALAVLRPQQRPLLLEPAACGQQVPPGFNFVPGMDVPGLELAQAPVGSWEHPISWAALAAWCDATAGCVAVTTAGSARRQLAPRRQWRPLARGGAGWRTLGGTTTEACAGTLFKGVWCGWCLCQGRTSALSCMSVCVVAMHASLREPQMHRYAHACALCYSPCAHNCVLQW
jgi:hypothetical protein